MLLVLSISIIVLVILLCIPPTRALIVVFFIKHFPSPIKIILAVAVVVAVVFTVLVLLGATLFWWFWSIYGSVLFVIAMLAIFSRWSPLAKLWLWRIVVIGLLLSLLPLLSPHYQSASNWLHEKLPALTEWQSTNQETVNTTIQESSLWMRGIIADSEVTKGSFGSISGSGVVGYDELGGEIPGLILSNGQPIKATGKTIAQNKKTGDEGMIQIMLPNKHGDFVGGRILWVTLRNATWKKQVAKEEEKVSVTPPTFVVTLPASVPPPPETKPAPAALVSPPKPKEIPPPVSTEKKVAAPQPPQPISGRVYERRPVEVFVPDPLVVQRETFRPRWDGYYSQIRKERRYLEENRWRERQRRSRHEPPPSHYYERW